MKKSVFAILLLLGVSSAFACTGRLCPRKALPDGEFCVVDPVALVAAAGKIREPEPKKVSYIPCAAKRKTADQIANLKNEPPPEPGATSGCGCGSKPGESKEPQSQPSSVAQTAALEKSKSNP